MSKTFSPANLALIFITFLAGYSLIQQSLAYLTFTNMDHWPSTSATLAQATYTTTQNTTRIQYTLNIQYTYQVDGSTYTSSQYSPKTAHVCYDETEIQTLIADLKSQSPLTIYYDPADPSLALISKDWNPAERLLNFALIAIIPLVCLFFLIKNIRKTDDDSPTSYPNQSTLPQPSLSQH
ncbi:DUF3592 domain-containing protein [Poriferisphaera sp. WC338]|uniref:DUF3592 domain-containing protein n=1 Tax=Poriferisphaera sp. WC338 TaxID=3425129 RepID=UPI003D813298